METKPWYKSMTILASFAGIALMWAQGQGFITADQVEATQTLGTRLLETGEAILAALTVWGLRRAVSPIEGPSGTAGASVAALVILGIVGCANFDASRVAALAGTHGGDAEISTLECRGFESLAQALVEGPDVAMRYLGRANELERLSIIAQRHSAQCHELIARFDVSPELLADVASSFNITWAAAQEATQ